MNYQVVFADMDNGASSFVQSELFARTFKEGMMLVEETANYLDGEGRKASKTLSRSGAITYASASMRLTTQLMQIASWLLVLRAVREGDMKLPEAQDEKYRLKQQSEPFEDGLEGGLPPRLVELIDSAAQLYGRISRLDVELFTEDRSPITERDAAAQQRALAAAFGQAN